MALAAQRPGSGSEGTANHDDDGIITLQPVCEAMWRQTLGPGSGPEGRADHNDGVITLQPVCEAVFSQALAAALQQPAEYAEQEPQQGWAEEPDLDATVQQLRARLHATLDSSASQPAAQLDIPQLDLGSLQHQHRQQDVDATQHQQEPWEAYWAAQMPAASYEAWVSQQAHVQPAWVQPEATPVAPPIQPPLRKQRRELPCVAGMRIAVLC